MLTHKAPWAYVLALAMITASGSGRALGRGRQTAEVQEQRIGTQSLLRTWHGSDGTVQKQELRPCLPDGTIAATGDVNEPLLTLDADLVDETIAHLAPATRLGDHLCGAVTATGPHRIRFDTYQHATIVQLLTAGHVTLVTIEWKDGRCPFVGRTPPN